MPALLFHPKRPGDHEATPEARIASIAMHAYFGEVISGELHAEGHSDEYIRERFWSSMSRAVMELYPAGTDGASQIFDFADQHGLVGCILPKAVN